MVLFYFILYLGAVKG
jgi:hypothetical protein